MAAGFRRCRALNLRSVPSLLPLRNLAQWTDVQNSMDLHCKGCFSPVPLQHIAAGIHLWSKCNTLLHCPSWRMQHLRLITQSQKEKKKIKKKKKKKNKRCIIKKLKHLRHVAKIKKSNMDHEQKLLARIERAKQKIDALQKAIESYKLPPLPEPVHDPESLTEEELHYLKRMGYKHKNYILIGIRGVFGGVVLNMHLHWKKHQLVKIKCKNFTKEEIDETGEQLARLSGGIVVDVQNGNTIVMFRGRNYKRPVDMTPKNTLSKRKALFKAKFEQSLKSVNKNLIDLERELVLYREHKSKKEAGILAGETVEGYISSWSDTEDDHSHSEHHSEDSDTGCGTYSDGTYSDIDSDVEVLPKSAETNFGSITGSDENKLRVDSGLLMDGESRSSETNLDTESDSLSDTS